MACSRFIAILKFQIRIFVEFLRGISGLFENFPLMINELANALSLMTVPLKIQSLRDVLPSLALEISLALISGEDFPSDFPFMNERRST